MRGPSEGPWALISTVIVCPRDISASDRLIRVNRLPSLSKSTFQTFPLSMLTRSALSISRTIPLTSTGAYRHDEGYLLCAYKLTHVRLREPGGGGLYQTNLESLR
jgi:hypothetical protein